MTLSRSEVRERLREVEDPELGEDVVSLEMVESIEVDADAVSLDIDVPNEDVREQVEADIRDEFDDVDLDLSWNVEATSGDESQLLPDVDRVVAVSSGKGGVGKSTYAVNFACHLARDNDVGLLDADVYGPNVPRMLGDTEPPRVTRDETLIPPEKHGVEVMSMGYLTNEDSPVVWRGAMVHKALTQLLGDVEWGSLDYLVVDLPPGTGDAQLTIAQTVPVTGAVIVTTPQSVSIDDSRKGVEMFRRADVEVAGVVENMSGFVCPDCGGEHDVFGAGGGERLADEEDVEFLGSIPLDPRVRDASDAGEPVVLEGDSVVRDAIVASVDAVVDSLDEIERRSLPML
ncbi:MAG: P-loop NTPase [Halobacteriales archaeon]